MRFFKLLTCLLFSLLFFNKAFTQKAPIKWGKISDEDLQMTSYALDPEAEAVVLCEYAKLRFEHFPGKGLAYRYEYHKRIKLLKSSAFDLGNIAIPYYSHQNSEKLTAIQAQVILPDGTKKKIKNKDIFNEDVNDYWKRKRFAIPNLQEGCIIEYKYDLISDQVITLKDWYFQDDIPIRHSELLVSIPEFLDYIFLFQSKDNISKSNIEEQNGAANSDFGGARMEQRIFIMKDMPALKEETYITTMDDYRARIKFQLRGYEQGNGLLKKYLTTWEKLAEELDGDDDYGHQYRKKGKHKKLLAAAQPAMAKAETPKEKIHAAQQFICENMTWNGNHRKYPDDGDNLDRLFEKKQAGSGAMNLMLLTILQNEGIKAWPLLASTRDHGKMITLYPIFDQFNHTMVYVELDGEALILDAHDDFHPVGYPHISALNSLGWVADKENPRWVNVVPPKTAEKYLAHFSLNEKGTLTGTLDALMEGYNAVNEREDFKEKKDGGWKKGLTDKFPEASIDTVTTENKNDLYQPLKIKIECELPGAAQINGDFIYLSPILFTSFEENPFKLEKRAYPVDIPYPFKEVYVLNLSLPEGYGIEELPEGVNLSLPNKGGSFKFSVKAVGEKNIQLINSISISQLYFIPEEYQAVKYFFDLIVEKLGEQIVLKKKT